MPAVSIILPTKDRPALLSRAVRSVLAQTEPDWELLIIDNNRLCPPVKSGGRDATPWDCDPRITIVRVELANASIARNVGLEAARGDWITYLDDDDVYRPLKVARQLQIARETGAPLVLCGAKFHLKGRTRVVQCGTSAWAGDELLLKARWNTPLLFHCRTRERFDRTLSPGEDAEFAHRLLARRDANAVPVVPEPLVDIYPQDGPRVNSDPLPLRSATVRILALRRHYYSRRTRRRFILQTLLAREKLVGHRTGSLRFGLRLLWESRGSDWRVVANAAAVAFRIFPRWWIS